MNFQQVCHFLAIISLKSVLRAPRTSIGYPHEGASVEAQEVLLDTPACDALVYSPRICKAEKMSDRFEAEKKVSSRKRVKLNW